MVEKNNWAIIEDPDTDNGLPNHWEDLDMPDVDFRVMKTFSSRKEAKDYRERNYGMYASEAHIINLDFH
jgi:hypothetical protein